MKLDSTDPTSATLIGRVGLGSSDQAAWERFVDLYGPRIRGWCRRWGLQEADSEDVTQEVLLRLSLKLRSFTCLSTGIEPGPCKVGPDLEGPCTESPTHRATCSSA